MRGKFFILCLLFIFPAGSNLAQWTKLNDPEILIPLWTYAIAAKGDTLFVGNYRGTIYRSFDNGLNWNRSDSGISNIYWTFNFLITDNTVFAIGDYDIYRSTDWGDSWELKNNGLLYDGSTDVYEMVKLNNLLFAATVAGVYSSSDNGDNWIPTTDSSYWSLSLSILNGILFEGTYYNGVYYSNDNGHTWNTANTGLPKYSPGSNMMPIKKLLVDGGYIYAGVTNSYIYHSTNNGKSWLPDSTGPYDIWALAKIDDYIYAGTQSGMYRKNNSENTWTMVNSGFYGAYVYSFTENNGKVFAASDYGLYSSSIASSIHWTRILGEFRGRISAQSLAYSGNSLFIQASSAYYNGTIDGVFRTTNSGNSWLKDATLSNNGTSLIQAYGDSLYALGNDLMFSSDSGNDWTKIDIGLPSQKFLYTVTKNNDSLFIAGGFYDQRVYLSIDNGKTWEKIWSSDTSIYAINKIGNYLFLGSLKSIFRSTDLGENWVSVNNGLPSNLYPSNLNVISFANIEGNILVRTSNGVYISTNYGDNWSEVDNGLPENTFDYDHRTSMSMIVNNNEVLIGTKDGVYITKNLGNNWTAVNDGLSGNALVINSLTINGNDLYIATNNGVWKRPLAGIVAVENNNDNLPEDFLLYQNYPNPFNPSTTIKYSIPQNSLVSLKVYNILGEEVATLVNEEKHAGRYEIKFDGSYLSSGVYFYQIQAGDFIQTKKIILLR